MGTIYIDTGGNAANSGSTDTASPTLSGAAATVAASVVSLDGSPTLTGNVITTAGATQSSIYLADATNANKKIFWITAFDDTLKTVTVDTAPTGVTSSAWRIGGRHVLTNASVEGALRAGDTAIFNNSPAAAASTIWTFRIAGTAAAGMPTIQGKAGTRPVFNTTNTATCVTGNSLFNTHIKNLELDQDGASGDVLTAAAQMVIESTKISDGGGNGIAADASAVGTRVFGSEVTGVSGDGINLVSAITIIMGNYIHDNTGDGLEINTGTLRLVISFNIFDTNGGRGVFFSAAVTTGATGIALLNANTVYGNGNSGLEITDTDTFVDWVNNIFQNNGDAANEYNVEKVAGTAEFISYHAYNCYNTASAGGSANLLNVTTNTTEITTDPLFTNAASGDFSLGATSPAKATGYPGQFLGGNLGYLDMGAVQRREPGGYAFAFA